MRRLGKGMRRVGKGEEGEFFEIYFNFFHVKFSLCKNIINCYIINSCSV